VKYTNVMNNGTRWDVVRPDFGPNGSPGTCFPVGFDRTGLAEITQLDDTWRVYVREKTGERIDCYDFFRQMRVAGDA